MNIFYLDKDAHRCAEYHCDKHVVKMIVETAQLLSTAHHIYSSVVPDGIYKLAYAMHPCSIWTRTSTGNYEWLFSLFTELCNQYTVRYDKVHQTSNLIDALAVCPNLLPHQTMISSPQCMPVQYRNRSTVRAYRNYYMGEKRDFAKWSRVPVPNWWR